LGKISPKKEIKYLKLKNEVDFKGFNHQKIRKKRVKNHQISIFGFQCVAKYIKRMIQNLYFIFGL
jgi:hypothetical protein